MDQKPKFIPQWTEDKRFSQGFAISVIKRSDHWRPRYSYELAFVGREKTSRYCYVRANGEGTGKIVVDDTSADILAVINQTREYIRDMYQAQEDEAIERKAEKERAQLNQDKPAVKPGLKTLSKIDKLARARKS